MSSQAKRKPVSESKLAFSSPLLRYSEGGALCLANAVCNYRSFDDSF